MIFGSTLKILRAWRTANDGGGAVSVNAGKTWTDEDFPTAQLYHVIVTSDVPYMVAGAQQDNSTIAVPSEGWTHMSARTNTVKRGVWTYAVGGGESGYIAQDPKDPDVFLREVIPRCLRASIAKRVRAKR